MSIKEFILWLTIPIILLSLIGWAAYSDEQNNHKDQHIEVACIQEHGTIDPLSGACVFGSNR